MSGCKGMHCHGCHSHDHGHGPNQLTLGVALLAFVSFAALREAPKVIHILEIVGYTVAAVSGTAIVGTLTFFIVRAIRRRRAATRALKPYDVPAVVIRMATPELDSTGRTRTIESGRLATRWLGRNTSRPALGKPRRSA